MRAIGRLVVVALLCLGVVGASAGELIELSGELSESGSNYEDPCFWQDAADPHLSLACITSKGKNQVECFNLVTGEFAGAAAGFNGDVHSCDVDQVKNELISTDTTEPVVLVHKLPTLEFSRFLPVPDAKELTGVCVLHRADRSLVVVTDEGSGHVIALDSETGEVAWRWAHGLTDTEGVTCDDELSRLILCDDKSGSHGCQVFGYDGKRSGEPFGAAVFGAEPEGVAIYRCPGGKGYIVAADPDQGEFEVFRREDRVHVCSFSLKSGGDFTTDTDGIEILQSSGWPQGLFGACDECSSQSDDQLDLVEWKQIAAKCKLEVCAAPAAKPAPPPAPAQR